MAEATRSSPTQPSSAVTASQGPALQIEDLRVTLEGKPVVRGLTFEVPRGSCFGILGPNGAGKTTVLRAVLRLLPYQGRVQVLGHGVDELTPIERARRMSYVPQRSELTAALTVGEVVALGRFCHRLRDKDSEGTQQIDAALAATGCSGLEDRPFSSLSGGEQRRVLLARALATEAPLVLLDEPTASLDVAHALSLFSHLRKLTAAGYTFVVVIHDLNDALDYCDQLLLLRGGSAFALGTPEDALSSRALREVYGVVVSGRSAPRFRLSEEAP